MRKPEDSLSEIRWIAVRNISGGPIPPYGCMALAYQDTDGTFAVTQPASAGLTEVLFNGPTAIGDRGTGHASFPGLALLDGAQPPNLGDSCGTAAGQWGLHVGNTGFTIAASTSSGKGFSPSGNVFSIIPTTGMQPCQGTQTVVTAVTCDASGLHVTTVTLCGICAEAGPGTSMSSMASFSWMGF